jgi:Dolichyl-phosphate-mannose-protein mannosyltransferase
MVMYSSSSTSKISGMSEVKWRQAIGAIVALFVVSRGALVLVAAFLERNIPLAYHGPTYSAAPILSSLTGSDSVYLLGIAANGYHAEPITKGFLDWAFFPLYPLATRLVSYLTFGDVAVAGIVVSNLAFVAALVVLYQLAFPYLGHDVAVRSLVFVAFAPGAVAFAMAYTDSLYLLLSAGAFLAAEQRRWRWMAVLYGLASLTRPQGILLGLPLLVLLAEASGGWRTPRLGWLASGPIAVAGFSAYLDAKFGDPLGMLHAQRAWTDIGQPGTGPSSAIPVLDRSDVLVLLLIAVLVLYAFLLLFRRVDRMPLAYTVLGVVAVLTPLITLRLNSSGRFMASVWPFAWILANRKAAWFATAVPAAFGALFVVFAVLNFTQTLAP